MKIKYDLDNNYFELFDEAQGIAAFKNEIKKDPYKRIYPYTKRCFKILKYSILILLISLILYLINDGMLLTKISLYLLAFTIGIFTIMIVIFISSYFDHKSRKHSGEVQFSKNGILDNSDDGIKIGLAWNHVEFVIVTDSIVCILTKTPFFFFFNNEVKEEIIKAIIKYVPDIKIYNQGMTKIEIDHDDEKEQENNESK